jgi:hypothetical protein
MQLDGVADADRQAGVHFPDLQQAVDPGQVQDELRAYLVERGRQVVRDLPGIVDQATPEELAVLGRADCIDQHPGLSPDLAQYLELVAHNLERSVSKP